MVEYLYQCSRCGQIEVVKKEHIDNGYVPYCTCSEYTPKMDLKCKLPDGCYID